MTKNKYSQMLDFCTTVAAFIYHTSEIKQRVFLLRT